VLKKNGFIKGKQNMSTTKLLAALAFAFLSPPGQALAEDWTQKLPDGPGKETAGAVCAGCHEFFGRIGKGYTPAGWKTVVRMMINQGAPIPEDKIAELTDYLAKSFPEAAKPAGAVLPGPVKISFEQWPAATPGSRPHDPLAAHDGYLWYTGQLANVLGRVDPKTGAVKEFQLKAPHGGPHGIAEDKEGNIWYTGNTSALIGKLNPNTGEVTEYPLPDPKATDPHTLTFDQSGMLWFTVQNGNFVGRLDPKSGEIKLLSSPTPKSRPYGIQIDSKGTPFVAGFGTNKIASIDPKTLAFKEYELPNAGARPRRLAITSDDIIWYTDFSRGYLGRLDPATGKVSEWQSPSGPKSEPYGISAIGDVIWYSESGTTPNTVIRFDPKTEKFQSWVIPGGGNIVRNTSVSPAGDFVLANSLTNEVTLVKIEKQ
jgi:virginiamycin B lyase